ncbi:MULTISPECIES: VOC family protein [Actinomadura]|uniref:Methylmalonyl-CoA epimerase n=1 Tax=Actinomadura madurae TaxID=1993 RepID=A0A1I5TP67_9ACTN|nr:VOC family protein [Actinomadura madurae]SFP84835.1 methylmalonyl-CoA epimerase [Actinomadura madurae]SPT51661.1 4-hydroxyphenylpyruvate dioxygenase and related hemolysins [Actinomadura madurae]
MQIYRIDHVAQVTPDLDAQVARLSGLFGFRTVRTWDNPGEGVRGARLEIPGSRGQAWEVVAPSGEGSSLRTWLDEHGGRPGLHHVGAEVPDLEAVQAELEVRGIKATDGARGRWLEASLSPPEKGPGVLWRLRGPGSLDMCGDSAASVAATGSVDGPSLGIVALDHICQAFHDRDELARWYHDLAGFVQVWRTADDEHPDMADLVLNIPGSAICWEVIMPRGEGSFIERFLDKGGPGAHHVTFEVDDWDAAMAACEHHDTPTFDDEEGVTDGAAWKHTFIHPKHTGGVLVQLFWEERPGVWVRSDKVPPRWT